METQEMVFAGVMFITAISLIVVSCVLVKWKRKNFEFENEETLPLLAKRFSKIPLTGNLVILGLFFGAVLLSFLPPLLLLLVFLLILLIIISISVGLASGLLGIFCSIACIKRNIENGNKYIIASTISTLISLRFLLLYIEMIVDKKLF